MIKSTLTGRYTNPKSSDGRIVVKHMFLKLTYETS